MCFTDFWLFEGLPKILSCKSRTLFTVQKENHKLVKESPPTHSPQDKFGFEFPLVYSIRVIGRLEKSWSNHLRGLTLQSYNATVTDGIEMTKLTGELFDQATLSGVLNALYNLRLTIRSVECLGTPADPF